MVSRCDERKTQRRRWNTSACAIRLRAFNRRFFEEEMQRPNTKRNMPMSLILCDVNGLKLTNDIFGHAYGDELIKRVAEVLRESCRAEDILARWGGDEFVLLLPGTDYAQAADIAARISEDIASQSIQAIQKQRVGGVRR